MGYRVLSPKADGTKQVSVANTCTSGEGVTAIGEPQNTWGSGAFTVKFNVPFFAPFAHGNYWVLWQSEDKNMVVVGEPCRYLMWVLSRTESPDENDVNKAWAFARDNGYD